MRKFLADWMLLVGMAGQNSQRDGMLPVVVRSKFILRGMGEIRDKGVTVKDA